MSKLISKKKVARRAPAKTAKVTKVIRTNRDNPRRKQNYHGAKWQTFRLFSILYAHGKVHTAAFARECGVCERTAQRVMEPFKEDGILTQDEQDQGLWHFNEARYRWDRLAASDHEAAALTFMCKFAKVFGGQLKEDMVNAINKAFMLEADEYPYFMITGRVKSPDMTLEFFQDLYDSIHDKLKVNLTYRGGDGAEKTVKASPISFVLSDGIWYLCYLRETPGAERPAIRTVRYTHILKVKPLEGEYFEKPAWVKETLQQARNIWFDSERPTKVLLEVDNALKDYFQLSEYFPLQKIVEEGPATFKVETLISNFYEVIPNIMRFMPSIRVLSPAELKADVQERAKAFLSN